jgi:hypothetical protein
VEVPHAVAEWIAEVVEFFASIDAFVYTPPESLEQKQYEKKSLHHQPC